MNCTRDEVRIGNNAGFTIYTWPLVKSGFPINCSVFILRTRHGFYPEISAVLFINYLWFHPDVADRDHRSEKTIFQSHKC